MSDASILPGVVFETTDALAPPHPRRLVPRRIATQVEAEFDLAPYTPLQAVRRGRELEVRCARHLAAFRLDLSEALHRERPWLEALDVRNGEAPWLLLALPAAPGVTLSWLWAHVDEAGLAQLVIAVLRLLVRTPGSTALPLHGVLVDARGELSVMPPFSHVIEASALQGWWSVREQNEYCVGRDGPQLSHRLASTASALVQPGEFHPRMPRLALPGPLSQALPQLAPLDDLVHAALEEIRDGRAPAEASRQQWVRALTGLEAAVSRHATPLGTLVTDAWDACPPAQRWD